MRHDRAFILYDAGTVSGQHPQGCTCPSPDTNMDPPRGARGPGPASLRRGRPSATRSTTITLIKPNPPATPTKAQLPRACLMRGAVPRAEPILSHGTTMALMAVRAPQLPSGSVSKHSSASRPVQMHEISSLGQ